MPREPKPPTLQSVLAENLRRLRIEAGFSQDGFATRARQRGLPWNRSTVGDIEAGRRDLTLEEFALLPGLLDDDVTIKDWLMHDGPMQVAEAELTREEILGIREGRFRAIGSEDTLSLSIEDSAQREAEKGTARTLEITPKKVAAASYGLWGHGLTEERDARLATTSSERDLVRRKGHVTRALIGELRDELKRRRKG